MVDVSPAAGMSFLRSIYAQSWVQAWIYLNGTSTYEMIRLLDQIDREDLNEFLRGADVMVGRLEVSRIVFTASVVRQRKLPDNAVGILDRDLLAARGFLGARTPLRITSDPTLTLPVPVPNQAGLSDDDFEDAAARLGVETAAIKAVAAVEGGRAGCFAADGRPIIRYEPHVFNYKRTHGKYAKTHPQFAMGYAVGIRAHTSAQSDEYSMLYGAMLMRGQRENAFASASWGTFQIMGFNHKGCGFATATDFVQSMCRSASNQLEAFLEFSKNKGAARYLKAKDWAGFALHYNGPDYQRNNYDAKLAAAYRRAGGTV